jgi:hypothetical protein
MMHVRLLADEKGFCDANDHVIVHAEHAVSRVPDVRHQVACDALDLRAAGHPAVVPSERRRKPTRRGNPCPRLSDASVRRHRGPRRGLPSVRRRTRFVDRPVHALS